MKKHKIYLDICSFNRPYDDQLQIRIKVEAESKLYIQDLVKKEKLELVWSYILDYENSENPYRERRESIEGWKDLCNQDIDASDQILANVAVLEKSGIKTKDAIHLSCAMEADCDYFIMTDDKLIKKTSKLNKVKVISPIGFLKVLEEK
jgi:predicted nucleic acid-binding protein